MSAASEGGSGRILRFAARLQADMGKKGETFRTRSCPWCDDPVGITVRLSADKSRFSIRCSTFKCFSYGERPMAAT